MGTYLMVLMVLGGTRFLVSAQVTPSPTCNYQQDMVPDKVYYIYQNAYPNRYSGYQYCRWSATAPTGYHIKINCSVNIPYYSSTCPQDRLTVSITGDTSNVQYYCGSGTFSLQSEKNKLRVELLAPVTSPGGTFSCSLIAPTPVTEPPPVCDCGWKKETRIVNGQETGVNEYSMMAGLIDISLRELICGSTIISNRYVLTAAHCLLNQQPTNIGVLIGDHDISTGTETNTTKLLMSETFIGHPNYDSSTHVNDLALIRVVGYIYFSLEVGPACLPFRYPDSPNVNTVVTVLGWGTIEHAGPKSDVLMKTQLDVVPIKDCQDIFGNNTVSENQICTFRQGTDACQADSGGPVVYEGERVWLEGVVSYGKNCALQYPGVNTRVGKYLVWILQSTPGETYCVR